MKDAHPLPRIDGTLEALKGAKIFSTLDLKSGYWQVPIREEYKSKTAFMTSSGQLFEFSRLPFGLCNAPATFSRLIDNVLSGLSWEVCLYYFDDIIAFSKDWGEHLQRLRMVLCRLREANHRLGHKKCTLARSSVIILRHLMSEEGLQPDQRLLDSIREIQPPTTVSQVRSFLGLVNYYHRFIKGFSNIVAPLNRLLEKNKLFEWTAKCAEAYEKLKAVLLQQPVVVYPDFTIPFRLYTDASNAGLGAILAQQQDGKERIICCASRSLSKSEQNYSATKKECLTVVWGIKNFSNYLIANHFKVYTDLYSLQWLCSMKHESALLHRWATQLEDYDFEVLHRPGENQGHVDALSRLPLDNVHLLGTEKATLATLEATKDILRYLHEGGHLGLKKTLKLFQDRFVGVQEKTLCREVISECLGCQLRSDYKPCDVPKGKIESSSPWNVLSIDIMGPFVAVRRGERYILSIIDCFSRYLILVPLHDHTATTVSCALYERVIGYFGCPKKILSDQGTEFASRLWKELLELLGIQQMLTSPYYPQGNGIVERSHRMVSNGFGPTLSTEMIERGWTSCPASCWRITRWNKDNMGIRSPKWCGNKV